MHGAVYQVVRAGQEQAGLAALKLALMPGDPRLAREGVLLSLVDHPSIPRLLDSGEWQHPLGTRHPFLVMQWVDGAPLYRWAEVHSCTSHRVLRMLAQLARALQALHSQGGVHRDVKGGNILVRHSDDRAILTDFGSGNYAGAATLTPPMLIPGTPAYRSPEAALSELRSLRASRPSYAAGPADDLYALGVTACRLVTGDYPELGEPRRDENGLWQVETVVPPPSLFRGDRVAPPLRALILRMLSVRPEERGTAAELAELLEHAAESMPPGSAPPGVAEELSRSSAQPLVGTPAAELRRRTHEPEAQVLEEPSGTSGSAGPLRPRAQGKPWRLWLAAAATSLALASWVVWGVNRRPGESSSSAWNEAAEQGRADAGTAGLGDTASNVSQGEAPQASVPDVLAGESLPEPLPGQTRPDAKGGCPRKRQVALNGGCWLEFRLEPEECAVLKGHMFKGTCYVPFIRPGRPPASISPWHQP